MSCGFVFLMLLGLLIFVANQPPPPRKKGLMALLRETNGILGGFVRGNWLTSHSLRSIYLL